MKLKLLITATLLALAVPAAADFVVTEQAYEVALSDMRLPQSENGTIAFRPCADCDYRTERVSVTTQWLFNERNMTLEKFRMALRSVENRGLVAVTVLHHVEEDRVTQVAVHVGGEHND